MIGVVSYLLINFWFTRIQANKAAILALTMNRVGDMGLSIGFFAIIALLGSLNYSTLFSLAPFMNSSAIDIIGILLLSGAMAKSAQIPLHSWLPGSMEGPTPVSALIHAATLVTAGLYLLVRSSPILEYSSTALLVITLVGASTAFFAATCGLVQNDLKRIIAFSTISQLGYMVMAVGLSQYNVALMHVVNHAFFKALLFLGAGAVIHSFSDQQDVRRLGGLINFLPFTYTAMLVGTLSLLATPWLTGFYSKDLIIELAFAQYSFQGTFAFILGSLTAGLTAFYSFRLISLVFLTYPNGPKTSYLHSHEASLNVIIPLFILALFSIFFGYVFSDLFVGIGSDFFANSIFIHPNHVTMVEAEFSMDRIIKLLPSILSLTGAIIATYLYHFLPQILSMESSITRKIYTFLNGKYLFDVIYNKYFIGKGLQLGYFISKVLDRGVIEFIGPYGLSNTLNNTGIKISKLDTGIITTYSLYITLGLLSLVFLVFAPVLLDTSLVNELRLFIIYLATLFLLATPLNKNSNTLFIIGAAPVLPNLCAANDLPVLNNDFLPPAPFPMLGGYNIGFEIAPDLAMVPFISDNIDSSLLRRSNLDKFVMDLDRELIPFNEAFLLYDPTEPLFITKVLKSIGNSIFDSATYFTSTVLQKVIESGTVDLFTKSIKNDLLIKSQNILEPIITGIKEAQSIGELTINELIQKALDTNLGDLLTVGSVTVAALQIISAGLLYKMLVNTYIKSVFPESELINITDKRSQSNYLKYRRLKITRFMIYTAPVLTFILANINKKDYLKSIKDFIKDSSSSSSIAESIILFFSSLRSAATGKRN